MLFVDEDVPGGATAYMMREVLERQGAFAWLDASPRTLTGRRAPAGLRLGRRLLVQAQRRIGLRRDLCPGRGSRDQAIAKRFRRDTPERIFRDP